MATTATPVFPTDTRVTGDMLADFVGERVRIVGKVSQIDTQTASLRLGDNELVDLKLSEGVVITDSIIEVVGILEARRVLRVDRLLNMGEDEGVIEISDKTTRLMHKPQFANMFGSMYGDHPARYARAVRAETDEARSQS
ncbi:hypothetical protein SISNIDRAFT_492048 [Sistotremastrum niveocremeum HHB9708]|uniref:Replication factor A protein 3 n=2 Tax=Sistotremastraceae TaxID=3402574 RepID=A0A164M450_9AGAM|nr:hypothetical protein SISNIDRAFT_492048 [Sistotremastrum niveocremeum HHB9708]KZT35371.1 hypothetical protein SISSUDRAFT_1064563 [Sistotremastrum suecicum HHB10207 ss-3]